MGRNRSAYRPVSQVAACVLGLALGAAGCAEDPVRETEDPTLPSSNEVLLDEQGTLPATAFVMDTFAVDLPAGAALGVIVESDQPIGVLVGGTGNLFFPGGAFAAVAPGGVDRMVYVRHGIDVSGEQAYRLRLVSVREDPEQAPAEIGLGTTVESEWLDPPLDVDVYSVHLEQGERFHVEYESATEPLAMKIEPPGGATVYAFTTSGPERAVSPLIVASTSGEHLLTVHRSGFVPDVQTRYRFRLIPAED